MAKVKTLEDFIKDYLRTQSTALGAEGYSKWIAEHGSDPALLGGDAKRAASIAYKTSVAGYGSNAQSIANDGLVGSGYSQYISTRAQKNKENAYESADRAIAAATAKNITDYSRYLGDVEKERDTLYESTYKALKADKVSDYDTAYKRAIERGLDEDDAAKVAEKASTETRDQLKVDVLLTIVSKKMTAYQTKLYSMGLGLDEATADELASYAFKVNESTDTDGATESYLEFLKELANKNKQ